MYTVCTEWPGTENAKMQKSLQMSKCTCHIESFAVYYYGLALGTQQAAFQHQQQKSRDTLLHMGTYSIVHTCWLPCHQTSRPEGGPAQSVRCSELEVSRHSQSCRGQTAPLM